MLKSQPSLWSNLNTLWSNFNPLWSNFNPLLSNFNPPCDQISTHCGQIITNFYLFLLFLTLLLPCEMRDLDHLNEHDLSYCQTGPLSCNTFALESKIFTKIYSKGSFEKLGSSLISKRSRICSDGYICNQTNYEIKIIEHLVFNSTF